MSSISQLSDTSCSVYDEYKRKQTRKYFDNAFSSGQEEENPMLTAENFKIDEDASTELR
jgi:hypothetical protein